MINSITLEITKEECENLIKAIETAHLPVKSILWPLHNKLKQL